MTFKIAMMLRRVGLACLLALGLPVAALAQDCTPGAATATLDANSVRAQVYPTGSLFYGPDGGAQYEAPKGSGLSSIFASSLWVGGKVNGDLRMAAATYADFGADYEFFPGPLAEDGTPPNPDDCSAYDRI